MAGQKLVEVSVLHVLCDHTERIAVDTHSKQANDVGVLQTGHDLYLFQEVIPMNTKRPISDLLHTVKKTITIYCQCQVTKSLEHTESIPCIFVGI